MTSIVTSHYILLDSFNNTRRENRRFRRHFVFLFFVFNCLLVFYTLVYKNIYVFFQYIYFYYLFFLFLLLFILFLSLTTART